MINTTPEIMVIKHGRELSEAIVTAISKSKECVQKELFSGRHINPETVTNASKNDFFLASIHRFFANHNDHEQSPKYDEEWVNRLYACSRKIPEPSIVASLIPSLEFNASWLNRTSCGRFKADALLILHFLWSEGAALLPMVCKLPTTRDPETNGNNYEFVAPYYPEVLSLVRKPFVKGVHSSFPDLSDSAFLQQKSLSNFGYYSWRLVRACSWYCVEDIREQDIQDFWEYEFNHDNSLGVPKYPISPNLILACIEDFYPERCRFKKISGNSSQKSVKNKMPSRKFSSKSLVSKKNIESGKVFISKTSQKRMEPWFKYQDRFFKKLRGRKIKGIRAYENALSNLNNYLCDEAANFFGDKGIPLPNQFTRKHTEGFDGIPSLLDSISQGRSTAYYRDMLYKISAFFDYLEGFSSIDEDIKGFVNPISKIDFPIVVAPRSTSKEVFNSESFGPLVEFIYGLEAFAFYISTRILESSAFAQKRQLLDPSYKVYDTEEIGFMPIVYSDNPNFNEKKSINKNNKKTLITPIKFIHKSVMPLVPRKLKVRKRTTEMFPIVIPLQHTLVALETGIRNMHIRWLDRRTYDKHIDRSYPLPPVCDLHVSTDKAHDAWDAKVSKFVIELLDRQVSTHEWFDEPGMLDEEWYDYQEESIFGKISTVFPRGLAAGIKEGIMTGPFSHDVISRHFKYQIFSFDLFCRYSLAIEPSNKMHEYFASVDSIDSAEAYGEAFDRFEESKGLILHTPHSCRASVVSEWIKILPPDLIGKHKTGHTSAAQVIYYAKLDPSYLKKHRQHQKLSLDSDGGVVPLELSSIKAEDENAKLQRAMKSHREHASIDFGATSFERPTDKGDILSGVKAIKHQPLDMLSFHGTHICPFKDQCPKEIINDLNAIPGVRMPCGGCYYSVKTVDHLPRISGHIRSLVEEAAMLKEYIDDARSAGASRDSLVEKVAHRKYLADEITAWSVTLHCLHQMYQDRKMRNDFLVEKPEIVTEQLEALTIPDGSLASLMARISEAKKHAEFFTPKLKSQIMESTKRILAKTGELHKLMASEPTGFSMLDEFRGLIRTTCETLGITVNELAAELERPVYLANGDAQKTLGLIFEKKSDRNV